MSGLIIPWVPGDVSVALPAVTLPWDIDHPPFPRSQNYQPAYKKWINQRYHALRVDVLGYLSTWVDTWNLFSEHEYIPSPWYQLRNYVPPLIEEPGSRTVKVYFKGGSPPFVCKKWKDAYGYPDLRRTIYRLQHEGRNRLPGRYRLYPDPDIARTRHLSTIRR